MFFHILGWATEAWIGATTIGVSRWLYMTARYPYTWNRPMPAPTVIEFTVRGDDTIGLI